MNFKCFDKEMQEIQFQSSSHNAIECVLSLETFIYGLGVGI